MIVVPGRRWWEIFYSSFIHANHGTVVFSHMYPIAVPLGFFLNIIIHQVFLLEFLTFMISKSLVI